MAVVSIILSVAASTTLRGVGALQQKGKGNAVGEWPSFDKTQNSVWVTSYPRSGSSTLLSMVVAPLKDEDPQVPKETFALFEPCHDGDEYLQHGQIVPQTPDNRDCSSLLPSLMQCDYSGVKKMWGWWEAHTTSNHSSFDADVASKLCRSSELVAVKTVDWGHDLSQWTWMLDENPNLRIIDVVRDPRGIYGSWKVLEPFASLVKAGDFYKPADICKNYAKNLDLEHPRIKRVVFEELVKAPEQTTRDVYSFLGRPFGDREAKWVKQNFDAVDCPPPPPGAMAFTDCHTKSHEVSEKWQKVLSEDELETFSANSDCKRVLKNYGFPEK